MTGKKWPQRIGRFEIEDRLGQGGMGTVYLARDPVLGRRVALKMIQTEIDSDEARQRFLREAQLIAALNHPNIVNVWEPGEFESRPYLVLEYIDGRTLADIIQSGEGVPLSTRLAWLDDVCAGLQFAHDAQIIHRDIKPSNLMLDHLGRIRILDFGIARIAGAARTQFTGLAGTLGYMSPEYILGAEADERVDIFAVGAVAYELLTNRPAFPGETHAIIMHRVIASTPAPLREAGIDPELERIVMRALEKTPEHRYQSASEFAAALRAVRARLGTVPSGDTWTPRARQAAYGAAAAGVSRHADEVFNSPSWSSSAPSPSNEQQPWERTASPQPPEPRPRQWSRFAAIAAGFVVIAAGTTGLVTYSRSAGRVVTPTPPVAVALPPTGADLSPAPAAAATLTVAVVDSRGGDVGETEVRLQPGNHLGKSNGRGGYVFEGIASGRYDVSATRPGFQVATKSLALGSAAVAETLTLIPLASEQPPVKPGPVVGGSPPAPKREPPASPVAPPPLTALQLFWAHDPKRPGGALPPPGAPEHPGLRYRVLQEVAGRAVPVDTAKEFQSGERVRFVFEANVDGYLYVAQEGSSGRWTVLFPNPEINNGRNAVRRFQQYVIPTDKWFFFDDTPGRERVFVFLSKEPMSELPSLNRPVTEYETIQLAALNNAASTVRTRDLVIEKTDSQKNPVPQDGTYVVNRNDSGTAVTAMFELTHK